MLKTGVTIAGRYEILGRIGSGGMADVYKAIDHKLNRFVAVKVLKPEFREDTTFIKKFKSEAQAAAGLTHPNIVNVFDVGDDDGVYFIVMELIEGITLKEYINKKGKLSVKEATSIAIQVSMGLEAAHSHGIVHRDVKPQNIIISTDGKVKVTDFGIARAASSNTISSNVMGSVHYSSPEQVRGGYSDEKSDIYSLGITLYEMVTGKVPFDGDTTVAIAIKHLQEEMVPPSVYAPELPFSLEQIIEKCTQKSVDRRYSKMEEAISDLKHSLIDPEGNFVKKMTLDNEAKTRVISDAELGEIKHTQKQTLKASSMELEEESFDTDYEEEEEEPVRERRTPKRSTSAKTAQKSAGKASAKDSGRASSKNSQRKPARKKSRIGNHIFTIIALIAGAAVLIGVIFVVGKAAGLIGGEKDIQESPSIQTETVAPEDDGMVEVPDIVGKTEEEAKELAAERNLGIQLIGEEASTQEQGRISSQDIPAGTKVEKNSTLKYYLSKGTVDVVIPSTDSMTAIEAEKMLKEEGLNVTIDKQYSSVDDSGYPLVDPGYAYYTMPDAGTTVKAGDTITLVVSRGVDYGDSAEVPNVVGMNRDAALTTLGKFIDITVNEQMSTEVPAGEVISQTPEGGSYADPDLPMTITVSTGNQDTSTQTPETSTETTQTAQPDQSQTTASGEVWKCTQTLNTPIGYNGGAMRLELLQMVNGEYSASVITEGSVLEFPYKLDITGASGVGEGTLYAYEQVDGTYQELGSYQITFEKAE